MVTSATRPPPSNHLLASLPSANFDRLASTLDIIPLKLKVVVHTAGDVVQHVYFPGGAFLSVLTVLEDGGRVEIATIGREGVAGLPAALDGDGDPSPAETIVQAEMDTCYRMSRTDFRREMDQRGAFYELIAKAGRKGGLASHRTRQEQVMGHEAACEERAERSDVPNSCSAEE